MLFLFFSICICIVFNAIQIIMQTLRGPDYSQGIGFQKLIQIWVLKNKKPRRMAGPDSNLWRGKGYRITIIFFVAE